VPERRPSRKNSFRIMPTARIFINADLIAQGVSPFSPEAAASALWRLMLEEIDYYAKRGANFGFETTLSGRSYLGLVRHLKSRGTGALFLSLGAKC